MSETPISRVLVGGTIPSRLLPNALKPGDTIAIVSPAGPTPVNENERDAFAHGQEILENLGYRVKIMPNARNRRMYVAGTDAERLSDLHSAFSDPAVNAILCARGGYGTMHLLDKLDYRLIRDNPKILIGYSDITALLTAIYQKSGLGGFYGPMLTSCFIHEDAYTLNTLLSRIDGKASYPQTVENQDAYTCFTPGIVEAPLTGGNLSLLSSLCGTPYQPKTAGHLLFIEDWKESYYSLDRQFQQLRLSGLFDDITGLLLCDFSHIESEPEQTLSAFLKEQTDFITAPRGFGFSVGHGNRNATLPIGTRARFDASSGELLLLESAVRQD